MPSKKSNNRRRVGRTSNPRRRITITRITEEKSREMTARRKAELNLFDMDELDKLTYPGYFTVFLDYFATGEGMTRGLCILKAASADNLRRALERNWGTYFAAGCEVRPGVKPIPGYEGLVCPQVADMLKRIVRGKDRPGGFAFTSTLYGNYS